MTEHLAAAHEGVVRGALLEMELQGPRISMAAYDRLISLKTGSFFGLAARFGGLPGGAAKRKLPCRGVRDRAGKRSSDRRRYR
jgi:geranylgeranyl pyrophosphate synthase